MIPLDADGALHHDLAAHMIHEEAFQSSVSESLRESAIALNTVALRLDRSEEIHGELKGTVDKIDSKIDGHDERIASLERSVGQAARIAKWFFGGGLIFAASSAYFVFRIVESLGAILKELPNK